MFNKHRSIYIYISVCYLTLTSIDKLKYFSSLPSLGLAKKSDFEINHFGSKLSKYYEILFLFLSRQKPVDVRDRNMFVF